MRKDINLRLIIASCLIGTFVLNTLGPIPIAQAYSAAGAFVLPEPGTMVLQSPDFSPPILKGLKIHPDNPFRFEFILDQGDSNVGLRQESTKLIKYFLASLTIPEKDLWVNLSPYEKNRIVPQSFGQTEMGRDLLAEDYMLKQITASLMYPEGQAGKKFWKRIYAEAAKKFGTTNIPVNTFNKVWIVPLKAVVYENAKAGTAYVVQSQLKVMLEADYLSLQKHADIRVAEGGASPSQTDPRENSFGVGLGETRGQDPNVSNLGLQIIREIIIPELTKEVNEGSNFAQLRQVYNSLILATWYKKKIRDSILAAIYENKNKVEGVRYDKSVILSETKDLKASYDSSPSPQNDTERIYQQYLQAFKKGSYNYIKQEQDPITQQMIPRKYFSGGFDLFVSPVFATDGTPAQIVNRAMSVLDVNFVGIGNTKNQAQTAESSLRALQDNWIEPIYRTSKIQERIIPEMVSKLTPKVRDVLESYQISKGYKKGQSPDDFAVELTRRLTFSFVAFAFNASEEQLSMMFGPDHLIRGTLNKIKDQKELTDEDYESLKNVFEQKLKDLPEYIGKNPDLILKILKRPGNVWPLMELFIRIHAFLKEDLYVDDHFNQSDLFTASLYMAQSIAIGRRIFEVITSLRNEGIEIKKQSLEVKKQYLIALYAVVSKGKNIDDVMDDFKGIGADFHWRDEWSDELKKQYLIALYVPSMYGKRVSKVIGDLKEAKIKWDERWSDELKKQYLIVVYKLSMEDGEIGQMIEDYQQEGIKWNNGWDDQLKRQFLIAIYVLAIRKLSVIEKLKILKKRFPGITDEMLIKVSWRMAVADWTEENLSLRKPDNSPVIRYENDLLFIINGIVEKILHQRGQSNPAEDTNAAQRAESNLRELQSNWIYTEFRDTKQEEAYVSEISRHLHQDVKEALIKRGVNENFSRREDFDNFVGTLAEKLVTSLFKIAKISLEEGEAKEELVTGRSRTARTVTPEQISVSFGKDTPLLEVLPKLRGQMLLTEDDYEKIKKVFDEKLERLPGFVKSNPALIIRISQRKGSLFQLFELFIRVEAYLKEKLELGDDFNSKELETAILRSSQAKATSENLIRVADEFQNNNINISKESREVKNQYLIALYVLSTTNQSIVPILREFANVNIVWNKEWKDPLKIQFLVAVYKIAMGKASIKPAVEGFGHIAASIHQDEDLMKQYITAVYNLAINKVSAERVATVIDEYRQAGIEWDENWNHELKKEYLIAVYSVAIQGGNVTELLRMFDIHYPQQSPEMRLAMSWRMILAHTGEEHLQDKDLRDVEYHVNRIVRIKLSRRKTIEQAEEIANASMKTADEKISDIVKDMSKLLTRNNLPEFDNDVAGTTDDRGGIEIDLGKGRLPWASITNLGPKGVSILKRLKDEKIIGEDVDEDNVLLRPNLKSKEAQVRQIVKDSGGDEPLANKIWGILQQARTGYRYFWPIFGFGGDEAKGWEVTIKKAGKVKDFYKLEVLLTKNGVKLKREFYVTNFLTKVVKNRYGGPPKPVLDIIRKEVFVKTVLAKLLDDPKNLQRNLRIMPNFRGMPIMLDKKGHAFFTVREPVYIFPWYILGQKEADGYSAVVKRFKIQRGVLTFQVEFNNGTEHFAREFQIGFLTRKISSKKTKRKITVLDIDDRLGLEGIKQRYINQKTFNNSRDNFRSLKGMNLGETNSDSDIFFSYGGHEIRWKISGTKTKPGWKAVIADDYINKDGYYEVKVMITKDGYLPEYYVFEIGRLGYSVTVGKEKLELFHIVPKAEIARRQLSSIISDIDYYDKFKVNEQLRKLIGFPIRTTNTAGSIPLRIKDEVTYPWRALGHSGKYADDQHAAGWSSVIVDAQVNGRLNEFTVEFSKENVKHLRTFQVGQVKKELEGLPFFDIVPSGSAEFRQENTSQELYAYIVRSQRGSWDEDLEQGISRFNQEDNYFTADHNGQVRVALSDNQSIDFQGLEADVRYKIIPILEEGFGLYVYFEREDKYVFGFDTSVEQSTQREAGRRVYRNSFKGPDLGRVRTNIFDHVKSRAWPWNINLDVFEGSDNLGPFVVPKELRMVDANSLPPWFQTNVLNEKWKKISDIYQLGLIAVSPKTRTYLENYPRVRLDPDILVEVIALLHWQSSQVEKPVAISTMMATMIDRNLWKLSGINAQNDSGRDLAKVYLSAKLQDLESVGAGDIYSSSDLSRFTSDLQSRPLVLQAYKRIADFAWSWMFYDYIYRVNFKDILNMNEHNDEYLEILPFRHAMGLLNGPLQAEFKKSYDLADFAYTGMAYFMPYRLLKEKSDGGEINAQKQVDYFFRMLSSHGNYHLSQWHINLIYEALSAAASQGLSSEAQDIWNELRVRLVRKKLVQDAAMLDQQSGEAAKHERKVKIAEALRLLGAFWAGDIHEVDISDLLGVLVEVGQLSATFYSMIDGNIIRYPKRVPIGFGTGSIDDRIILKRSGQKIAFERRSSDNKFKAACLWRINDQRDQWVRDSDYYRDKFWSHHIDSQQRPPLGRLQVNALLGSTAVIYGTFPNSFNFEGDSEHNHKGKAIGIETGVPSDKIFMSWKAYPYEGRKRWKIVFERFGKDGQLKNRVTWFKNSQGQWVNEFDYLYPLFWKGEVDEMNIAYGLGVNGVRDGVFGMYTKFENPAYTAKNVLIGVGTGEVDDDIVMKRVGKDIVYTRYDKNGNSKGEGLWRVNGDKWEKVFRTFSVNHQDFVKFWDKKMMELDITESFGLNLIYGIFSDSFYFKLSNGQHFYPGRVAMGIGRRKNEQQSQERRIFMRWERFAIEGQERWRVVFERRVLAGDAYKVSSSAAWEEKGDRWVRVPDPRQADLVGKRAAVVKKAAAPIKKVVVAKPAVKKATPKAKPKPIEQPRPRRSYAPEPVMENPAITSVDQLDQLIGNLLRRHKGPIWIDPIKFKEKNRIDLPLSNVYAALRRPDIVLLDAKGNVAAAMSVTPNERMHQEIDALIQSLEGKFKVLIAVEPSGLSQNLINILKRNVSAGVNDLWHGSEKRSKVQALNDIDAEIIKVRALINYLATYEESDSRRERRQALLKRFAQNPPTALPEQAAERGAFEVALFMEHGYNENFAKHLKDLKPDLVGDLNGLQEKVHEFYEANKDDNPAMNNQTGGIDLSSDQAFRVQNNGEAMHFHIDPAQLAQLQNTSGFIPVIISMRQTSNIRGWLGIR